MPTAIVYVNSKFLFQVYCVYIILRLVSAHIAFFLRCEIFSVVKAFQAAHTRSFLRSSLTITHSQHTRVSDLWPRLSGGGRLSQSRTLSTPQYPTNRPHSFTDDLCPSNGEGEENLRHARIPAGYTWTPVGQHELRPRQCSASGRTENSEPWNTPSVVVLSSLEDADACVRSVIYTTQMLVLDLLLTKTRSVAHVRSVI
ncbi:hypothetical protein BaRGS_00001522 [Batillaria attramentaria]|uniref:Uncharacterized protein n=1 Tax=Batillaria attramentaria TaxID=370345 RepID=A0ABD0M7D3_9CAEN